MCVSPNDPRGVSRRTLIGAAGGMASLTALPALALARQATPSAGTNDPAGVTPDRVARAVDELDGIVANVMNATGIPGVAAAIVYRDEVVAARGYGVRRVGQPETVDADTVFQLASVSKPIASTVVAGIVGDDVVTWDSKLTELYPGFALYDPLATHEVTIRDMFSHRSGLPDHAGDLNEDIGYDRSEVLRRLRYQPLTGQFRATYAYTNFGLTAAAEAAAVKAGMSWEDLSAERLYTPLGMSRTSSRFADYESAPTRAYTHVRDGDSWAPLHVREPDAQSPAGGVSSTVADMAQWMRLQLGGGTIDGKELISSPALGETHLPHMVRDDVEDPTTQRAPFYGLGWNVDYDAMGRVQLSHSGAFALGAGTTVYLLPEDQFGVVVLTNAAPMGGAESIALGVLEVANSGAVTTDFLPLLEPFFAAMDVAAYGTEVDYGTPPADARAPRDGTAYLGRYANDYHGEVEVTVGDDELALLLGPEGEVFPMTHYDGDVFAFQPRGENAFGPSGMMFTIAPDGMASSVTIEYLDVFGLGTFTRKDALG